MKKLLLAVVLFFGLTAGGFAQSLIEIGDGSLSPDHGVVGTDVQITDSVISLDLGIVTNLINALLGKDPKVYFGSVEATECTGMFSLLDLTLALLGIDLQPLSCNAPAGIAPGTTVSVKLSGDALSVNLLESNNPLEFTYDYLQPSGVSISPVSGPTGTQVTITGANLEGVTVSFGGVTATGCTSVSGTEVSCPAPKQATPGALVSVTVSNPDGLNATADEQFQYTAAVLPDVDGVSPQPALIGASVIVSAAETIPADTIVLFGNNPAECEPNTATSLACSVPDGSGTVEVKLSDGAGGLSAAGSNFTYAIPSIAGGLSETSGYRGQTITITSLATISSAAKVVFTNGGSVNAVADCESVSINSLTCEIPDGYGNVTVELQDVDGASGAGASFHYNLPDIKDISPNPALQGTTVTVTADLAAPAKLSTGTEILVIGNSEVKQACTVTGDDTLSCTVPAQPGRSDVKVFLTDPSYAYTSVSGYDFLYGQPAPDITNLSSGTGYIGDEITVTVASQPGAGTGVYFGDVQATCDPFPASSPSTTTCTVPSGMGEADVTLFDGTNRSAATPFTYTVPDVQTVESSSAFISAVVTITATHEITEDTIVLFGSNEAQNCTLVTPTSLSCNVPEGSGTVEVKFSDGEGGLSVTPGSFTYMIPSITGGLSRSSGNRGEVITITSNAIIVPGTRVMFGDVLANSCERVSALELSCRVPNAIGLVDVALEDADGTRGAGVAPFQYLVPEIVSIDPNPALAGSEVEVTMNLTEPAVVSTGTTVKFNGVETTCSVSGNTTLTCNVPDGTGSVDVVTTDGTTDSNTPVSFTYAVLTPQDIELSVTSGNRGDSITITAAENIPAGTTVRFGGETLTCPITNNTMTCTVPDGIRTVEVALVNDQGVTGNTEEFTYSVPGIVKIEPPSALTASTIIITATAQISTGTTVKFDGGAPQTCVITGDNTTMECEVPSGSGTVSVNLYDGVTDGAAGSFTYALSGVISVTPAQAKIGAPVTIESSGDPGAAALMFGSQAATGCTSFVPTGGGIYTATCPVPDGIGKAVVSFNDGEGGVGASYDFTYTVPEVVSLTPSSGKIGVSVLIETDSKIMAGNTVFFNETQASGCSIQDDTHITCPAPEGSGGVTVKLSDGTYRSATGQMFNYTVPAVASLSPGNTGGIDDRITITADSPIADDTVVKFGDETAQNCVVSGSTITCDVPDNVGEVDVTLENPSGTAGDSSQTFAYSIPALASVLPSPTGAGQTVTITAQGGAIISSKTRVFFGAAEASGCLFSGASASGTCEVPVGTGTVDVRLFDGTAYGTGVEFTYALPAVNIVFPTAGKIGDTVTIVVTGDPGAVSVLFDGVAATGCSVFSAAGGGEYQATCTVPDGMGSVPVVLADGEGGTGSGFTFSYNVPDVIGLTPATGKIGASVTIEAGGKIVPGNTVMFGDTAATDCSIDDDTHITCDAPLGIGEVSVTLSDGVSRGSGQTFTYTMPVISGLSINNGSIGDEIVITADSAIPAGTVVMFGGEQLACPITGNTVTCIVPDGVGADVSVVLKNLEGTLSAAELFTYNIPAITNIDPSSALVGATVTITADSIISSEARVFFGGQLASGCSFSGSAVTGTCPVPDGSGENIEVALSDSDAGTNKGTPFLFDYMVLPVVPNVTGLTPAIAISGTEITITSDGAIPAGTNVLFGGTDIGPCIITGANTCTFTLPAGSATAEVKLTNSGVDSLSGWTFTYMTTPPTISGVEPDPFTGVEGDTVTITAAGPIQEGTVIMFGETPAANCVPSGNSITCKVPAGSGSVDVTLKNEAGESAPYSEEFVYAAVSVPMPDIVSIMPDTGAPGDIITIVTSDTIEGGMDFMFGAKEASCVLISTTKAECEAPEGTGVVTVTLSDGTNTGAGLNFTYKDSAPLTPEIDNAVLNAENQLIITGSNLLGATVTFNGEAAVCTVDSDTQITCPAPEGDDVTIRATAPNGLYGEFKYQVDSVFQTSDPVITGVKADYDAGKVIINGSYLNTPGLTVTFNGNSAENCSLSDTQIICDKLAADGKISIVVTDADGDTATATLNYISPENRPDPTKDPGVRAMAAAQLSSAQRNIRAQFSNVSSRLAQIRGASENRDSFHLSLGIKEAEDDVLYAYDPHSIDELLAQNNINRARSSVEVSDISRVLLGPSSQQMKKVYGSWFTGAVRFGSEDAVGDIDYTSYAFSGGLDKVFSQKLAGGVGFGYTGDKTDVSGSSSKLTSNSYSLALYGTYALSREVYFDGMVGYSFMTMDADRETASGAMATGTRDANAVFGSISSGYIYRNGSFVLSPYGRAQASWARLERYSESGADVENLIFGSSDVKMFVLVAGLESAYEFKQSWGSWIPRLSAEYLHNFDNVTPMHIGYVDVGTTPYSFSGSVYSKDNVTVGAGLDFSLKSRWTISGDYKLTIGDHLQDNRVSAMVNYSF